MKKSAVIGLFSLLFLLCFYWLNVPRRITLCGGDRLVSKEGKYSYILPEGWVDKGMLGDGVFIVNPDVENGISANIRIAARNAENKEVRAKISDQILSEYEGITLLDAEELETDLGSGGTVIYSVRTNKLGIAIHRSHYIVPHHSGVIVVAGTCAALHKDKYDPIFRGVAKSVQDE